MLPALLVTTLLLLLPTSINGHGMVLDPVARGSRWRCNTRAPANYDDMGLFCGGFSVQWYQNGGKCGYCGDNYADAQPRRNEIGGVFGQQGEIVRYYASGAVIEVKVQITANHMGHFEFNLCDLSGNGGKESDLCYQQYLLVDSEGRRKWYMNSTEATQYLVKLKLPDGLVCEHCVLQWTYVTGNNWGFCGDGTGKLGCGPQENFRTCSDIAIYDPADSRLAKSFSYCGGATSRASLPSAIGEDDWIFNEIPVDDDSVELTKDQPGDVNQTQQESNEII